MGAPQQFNKVKLFAGFIYRDAEIYQGIKERLAGILSPLDMEAGKFAFNLTDYYNQELGFPLFKSFISFRDLIDPLKLPDIKILTNGLEHETSVSGKRAINIDPGYLSSGNVILATTKNYYHRVPLQKGIYAHMEYVIRKKRVMPLEWTYPDFKMSHYMDFFNRLIQVYKGDLQRLKGVDE